MEEFYQEAWTYTENISVTQHVPFQLEIKRSPIFFLMLCLISFFSGPLHLFFSDLKTPTINFPPHFRLYVNKHKDVMKTYAGVLVDFSYTDTVSSSPKFSSTIKTKLMFLGCIICKQSNW